MVSPKEILYEYWRFNAFKGIQEKVIQAGIDGHDCCVFFPTGGGKSICFQVTALAKPGICVVLSPLISLMQDQVNQLRDKGIKAMYLKGGMSLKETNQTFDNLRYGNFKFLYMSPEKLDNTIIKEHLNHIDISLIAVDEAHCVSMWGHDFRPAFMKINVIREDICPNVPLMALTATATPQVQKDIIKHLGLNSPKIFKTSFKRPNIAINIKKTDNKWQAILDELNSTSGSGIVYVRNRKTTLDIAKLLMQNSIESLAFHGGMTSDERQSILEKWLTDKARVVVATTAFGMGIDKPDVSLVYHFHLPESLESYYQEIGRAGRNGKPCKAVMAYNASDIDRLKFQFLKQIPTLELIKKVYRNLMSFLQLGYGEGDGEEFGLNISEFSERYKFDISQSYEVFKVLDRLSIIALNKQFAVNTSLMIILNHREILTFLRENERFKALVTMILRTYTGVFDLMVSLNLNLLSKKLGISKSTILEQLELLSALKVIKLKSSQQDLSIRLLQPRGDDRTINAHVKAIKSLQEQKVHQIDTVIAFLKDTKTCHQVKLLNYFGEKSNEPCGICSVCKAKSKVEKAVALSKKDLRSMVLELIKEKPLSSRELLMRISTDKNELFETLKHLLEKDIIQITINNTYVLKHE
jgi:ATP-dependent DNA helicase RecQ